MFIRQLPRFSVGREAVLGRGGGRDGKHVSLLPSKPLCPLIIRCRAWFATDVNEYIPRGSTTWSPPMVHLGSTISLPPQLGAADAEIKVPSVENTELKGSPFKAWSRSVYSHAYSYAYCEGFLPC